MKLCHIAGQMAHFESRRQRVIHLVIDKLCKLKSYAGSGMVGEIRKAESLKPYNLR